MKENKYYIAYDKKLGRRTIHIKMGDYLISLITGSKHKIEKDLR